MDLIRGALQTIEHYLFLPVTSLYFSAPRAIGGWEGARPATICAHLAGSADVSFWEAQEEECHDMLHRRVQSHIALLRVAMYLFVLLRIAESMWTSHFVIGPALREMKRIMHEGESASSRLLISNTRTGSKRLSP